MKKRRFALLIFALAVGIFLFPTVAFAAQDGDGKTEATAETTCEFAVNFANSMNETEQYQASNPVKFYDSEGQPIGWIVVD